MQKKLYRIASKNDSRKIAEFLSKDGQLLLPFLELICNAEQAVDELIDMAGKAAIEAVLLLSAQQLAGPKQPGKIHGDITWDPAGQKLPAGTRLVRSSAWCCLFIWAKAACGKAQAAEEGQRQRQRSSHSCL